MAEARLQAELIETKAELQLKGKITAGTQAVHKDLSLIPKWNGAETGIPLDELPSIENIASLGLWQDRDKCQIAALRLTDAAKQLYNDQSELHAPNVTWKDFKDALRQRFGDTYRPVPLHETTFSETIAWRVSTGFR
jgi:hypothetical protein